MKQIVRYLNLTIPGKIRVETRITVNDTGSEYKSTFENTNSTNLTLYPVVSITIIRPSERDDTGAIIKQKWNPNDNLGMTKFNLPIFINNLREINDDMKTPDLYSYVGERLEINETKAEKVRKVFPMGNVIVELSAIVIVQDEKRVEGIKIKFNNEQSSVMLTLNEISSLLYNLEHIDVDSLSILMYVNFISTDNAPKLFDSNTLKPKVDIVPKDFQSDFV